MYRSSSVRLALGLIFATLFAFSNAAVILKSEFPTPPILYGGQAWVDQHLAPGGMSLTARVGDYEVSVDVEGDGVYRNLLLQPNSSDYYGMKVTFHAMGVVAEETDIFEQSGSPKFKTSFDLHFNVNVDDGRPTPVLTGPTPELAAPTNTASGQTSVVRLVVLIAIVFSAIVMGLAAVVIRCRRS